MRYAPLVLACCACLGGHQPHYDYYVLAAAGAPPRSAPPAPSEPSVAVSHVTVPDYLDRESIVTRSDDQRIMYSKRDRWAEPLEAAFARVLEEDLAAALVPAGIPVLPKTASPTYDVQVDVLRFERRGGERVELWARWTVRSDSQLVYTDELRVSVPTAGQDNAAATAALSHAVSQLADNIANQVKQARYAWVKRS